MRLVALILAGIFAYVATVSDGWLPAVAVAGAFLVGAFLWNAGGSAEARSIRIEKAKVQASQLDPFVTERVKAIAMAGRKIEAIKELRAATGLGLKEAKEAVEAMVDDGR